MAIKFTAANSQYINCGLAGWDASTDHTVCGWMYPLYPTMPPRGSQTGWMTLLCKLNNSGNKYQSWFGRTSSETISYIANGGSITTISTGTLARNAWNHIAAVYNTTTGMALYINGVLSGSKSTIGYKNSNGIQRIAANINATATDFMDGFLADIRVYDRSLNQGEVQTICFCKGTDALYLNLVNKYALSGPQDIIASSIKDLTAANDGISVNNPVFVESPIKCIRGKINSF